MAKEIKVKLKVDDKGTATIKKVSKSVKRMETQTVKSSKAMSNSMKLATAAVVAFGVAATLTFGKKSINAASNLQEVMGKFSVVFRDQIAMAEEFADVLVDSYGLSERAAKEYLSRVQDLLKPMGMASTAAAKMSNEVVKLAVNLGSFSNVPIKKVILDMESALVGNFETMKKYGVILNETVVKAEAYRSGLAKEGVLLNANQKAQAAYSLMVKGSADAIGDWARTSGNYANQLKQFKSNVEDISAAIGKPLMKSLNDVLIKTNEWIKKNKELISSKIISWVNAFTTAIKLLITAMEIMLPLIGTLVAYKLAAWFTLTATATTSAVTEGGHWIKTLRTQTKAGYGTIASIKNLAYMYGTTLPLAMKGGLVGAAAFIGYMVGTWLNEFDIVKKTTQKIIATMIYAFKNFGQTAQLEFLKAMNVMAKAWHNFKDLMTPGKSSDFVDNNNIVVLKKQIIDTTREYEKMMGIIDKSFTMSTLKKTGKTGGAVDGGGADDAGTDTNTGDKTPYESGFEKNKDALRTMHAYEQQMKDEHLIALAQKDMNAWMNSLADINEYNQKRIELIQSVADKEKEIEEKAAAEAAENARKRFQSTVDMLNNLSSVMGQFNTAMSQMSDAGAKRSKSDFERQKKFQMAQAAMSSAAASVNALGQWPYTPARIIEAALVAAIGQVHIATIEKQKYAYAKGGAFTNSVVSSPTQFNVGEMGEAGPEAILPLTKTSGGELGVKSQGGSQQPQQVNYNIMAMDSKSFVDYVRQNPQAVTTVMNEQMQRGNSALNANIRRVSR